MHRAIALSRRDFVGAVNLDLDDRRGAVLAIRRLLADDLEVLQLEERTVLAELLADEQFERAFRTFELIALVLHLLEPLHDAVGHLVILGDGRIDFPDLVENHASARHLAHQETTLAAYQLGIDVLERMCSLVDAVDVHATLVGESAVPDERFAFVERNVRDCRHMTRNMHDVPILVRRQAFVIALDAEIGDDR